MKRLAGLLLISVLSLACATNAMAQCLLPGFAQLPLPPPAVYLGPLMNYFAVTYPDVGAALVGGRDAWIVTDANGRIGGFGGVTGSDCPLGQPLQIGAHHFELDGCTTTIAYGFNYHPANIDQMTLAYVDYFPSQCVGCGTKSISLNTAAPWSTAPQAGQFDIQSVVAHEFGHVLGLGHIRGTSAACNQNTGPSCAVDSNRNTMQSNTPYGVGETCGRTVTGYDKLSADYAY